MARGWFEDKDKFRERMTRETNANTIRNAGRTHWGRGIESQADYDARAQLEADEIRSAKRSGSQPIRQLFEDEEEYRQRMRDESDGVAPDYAAKRRKTAREVSQMFAGERTSGGGGGRSGITWSGIGIFLFWTVLIVAGGPSACKQMMGKSTGQQLATLPVGTPNTAPISHPGRIVISASSGPLEVRDFLHNGQTIEDEMNRGRYYLAGQMGYCPKDKFCSPGETYGVGKKVPFVVVYDLASNSFTVALSDRPISNARYRAEDFLGKTLGLYRDDMCKLRYQVLTSSSVDSTYSGTNLGFSFCPGAVDLSAAAPAQIATESLSAASDQTPENSSEAAPASK